MRREREREMGAELSKKKKKKKKLKVKAGDKLTKTLELKKKKKRKNKEEINEKIHSDQLVEIEENSHTTKEEKRKSKSLEKKRIRNRRNENNVNDEEANQFNTEDDGKKKSKLLRNKHKRTKKMIETQMSGVDKLYNEMEDGFDERNCANEAGEKKKRKSRQDKRKSEKVKKPKVHKVDELNDKVEDGFNQQNDEGEMETIQYATQGQIESSEEQQEADSEKYFNTRKSKKTRKIKGKDHMSLQNEEKLLEKRGGAEEDEVYHISSGDEDCSGGMKKWITEYHQSRPGLKILQERIDDYITAHEAQEEQARKEREARSAEGGWTVVVHHKGRKKTTDSESGITVGSVAQATVMDNMTKKKSKEVGLDFYRFQKREAQRNEIMMLQSKFEQDKIRIQQMRAARKFRPY